MGREFLGIGADAIRIAQMADATDPIPRLGIADQDEDGRVSGRFAIAAAPAKQPEAALQFLAASLEAALPQPRVPASLAAA